MTLLRLGAACLALLLVGCDSASVSSVEGDTYRSEGTDYPHSTVALSGGQVLVGALVQGTIAPTDGTIGYPAVVRFSEGEVEAAVYDGDERDYFGIDGIAPLGDGLAVAIGSDDGVHLYQTDGSGGGRQLLARIDGARYLPRDALHAVPGGLVLAAYATEAGGPHLYGLSASGDVRWTYRLPEAQDIRALTVLPGGDLAVAGPGRRGGEAVVARLSPDGTERWRTELADMVSPVDITATEAEAVVVGQPLDYSGVRATRLDGDGDVVWARTLTDEPRARPSAVAALGDGTVAVGITLDDGDFETGNTARVAVLDADGGDLETVTVGEPIEASTYVQGLVALPDGRLGVVAAVGPKRLGGYGGDDFDIELLRLDVSD